MATERSRDTMAQRIGSLLNQADHAANEQEAEAFRDRAMQLIAKTGIEESEARGSLPEGTNVLEKLTFHLRGQYINQQQLLLGKIAQALHCDGVSAGNSRTGMDVTIYGVKIHTDRVRLLFSMLNPRMLAAASRTPPLGYTRGTRAYRVDWMLGYASRIGERLAAAEQAAATDRDTETGTTTQALVLVSDADRAKKAIERAHPKVAKNRYRRSPTATPYHDGRAAGERADLADRAQLRSRRSIGN